ncbi:uncharacterized protein KQ657_004368 [Scheffersomyces spartinae]|uniref:Transcription initiation factor TFIID subunit 1 n=1 Tax=Scheffersomyces spartinae TaxID=45513 RepID=A0A9P7VBX5_9ASCO|nr:uncharacterized protein KQ657_004368 [Scheffersomyces spartinae]KAG7194691.1 hypothetical protein KQ657_004368 [Scheffersomyces spartinae]
MSRGAKDGDDAAVNKYVQGNNDIPNDEIIDSIFLAKQTVHADDAIDYEDFDELAEDELEEEDEGTDLGGAANEIAVADGDGGMVEVDQEEAELQRRAEKQFDDLFGPGEDDDVNRMHVDDGGYMGDIGGHEGHYNDLNDDYLMAPDDNGLTNMELGDIFGDGEGDDHVGFEDDVSVGEMSDHEHHQQSTKVLVGARRDESRRKIARAIERLRRRKVEGKSVLRRMLSYYYPDYRDDKPFNFHKHFYPSPIYFKNHRPPIAFKEITKPFIPTKIAFELAPDGRKLFTKPLSEISSSSFSNQNVSENLANKDGFIVELYEGLPTRKPVEFLEKDALTDDKFIEFLKDLVLSTTGWDDEQIINPKPQASNGKTNSQNTIVREREVPGQAKIIDINYDDDMIFEGQIDKKLLALDMNDPNLLFVPEKMAATSKVLISPKDRLFNMKFNISNDKQYEVLKANYHKKVRSQLSNLNIEHSVPALRLQTPYYKVRLNKQECRSFHRPRFSVRPGTLVSFSKLKIRKRKKDRGKTPQEIFSRTSDLTLADTGPLIGMEYSEEYPQLLSNFGMCSKVVNYYRKETKDDNTRPKTSIGETHVLGMEDRSPFWNFGEVAPGQFVPTLYNNMVRTPIFKHDPKSTDFLMIRSQGAGSHQRFYLRNFNSMFAVGNVFPVVEVPAPHSRKVTNTSKNRLKMVVFRVMNSKGESRISVKDISKHFPEHNDMQNRQRLKEFMEYQRQGDDQGYWKIKGAGDNVPTEEDVRNMITPEDVCMLDSMQSGNQILEDYGYLFSDEQPSLQEQQKKKFDEKGDEKDDRKDKEKDKDGDKDAKEGKRKYNKDTGEINDFDIEEELAPWNWTRNFLTSTQTKTMLQLNGEGDPTGIGLGYSFLRATQKSSFTPLFAPKRENVPKNTSAAYQQKLYEHEIKRIWYEQRRSLADRVGDFDLSKEIYETYKPLDHYKYLKRKFEDEEERQNKLRLERELKLAGDDKEKPLPSQSKRVLRIERRFMDENGIVHRKVEVISDPRIIRAYVKRKKEIEDEKIKNADVDDIIPTSDKELNKIRKKALQEKLANLEKKVKMSKNKKPPKDSIHAAAAAGGTIIDANTVLLPDGTYAVGGKGIGKGKSTRRRCKSCGAFGHIRTNKSCPLYLLTKGGKIPAPPGAAAEALLAAKNDNNNKSSMNLPSISNAASPSTTNGVLPTESASNPAANVKPVEESLLVPIATTEASAAAE